LKDWAKVGIEGDFYRECGEGGLAGKGGGGGRGGVKST